MDALTFIVEIVKALAWPAAAIVLGVIFRKSILRALSEGGLKRLKAGAGGLEAEFFDQHLLEAKDKLPELEQGEPVESAPQLGPAPESMEEPVDSDMLVHAPAGSMLAAWRLLEKALRDAVREIDPEASVLRMSTARSHAEYLARDGLLSPALAEIVRSLQEVRNRVVHPSDADSTPTADQARDFVGTVDFVRGTVEETAKNLSARSLEDLLSQLKAAKAEEVQVAPAASVGVGANLEVARETARRRQGRFVAKRGGITMGLNRVEASRLLNAGAIHREHESALED